MISFEFESTEDITNDDRLQSEWLETNGLGGWANTTIAGINTRRYHGLLVAAVKPPTERSVLVSKLDETIVINGERFELGANDYGEVIHPNGFQYLRSFTKALFPQFVYAAGSVQLRKSIVMVHNENTTVIKYEVIKASHSFEMELLPLLAARGSHGAMRENGDVSKQGEFDKGQFKIKLYGGTPDIFIQLAGGDYHPNPAWYFHFNYSIEKYRGLDFTEDLFAPGYFSIEIKEGEAFYVVLSSEDKGLRNAILLFENEVQRRGGLIAKEKDSSVQQLILAADQFIVRRSDDLKTVIAGYPWFTDWGRDTMISLTGLCLSTKRYEDAKKILYAFAQSVDRGMLPNRFQDNNQPPEYNNVDGTLWYFIAIYNYLKTTKDEKFVLEHLLPVLKDIIDWHYRGTRYNIHVAEDGLLYAGEKGFQLTWMDAKIGDWIVTPRMGKPVEIQALWYNALKIFSELLRLNGQVSDAVKMDEQAQRSKVSFNEIFWFEEGGYLYDVIDENNNSDTSLRPNQLFAISLPFQLVEGKKAKEVLKIVEEKLYTPKGLRSLSPDDAGYISHYGGDQWHRDSSYHQGTVWSWLLGPFIDAIFKTGGSSSALTKSFQIIQNFLPHLGKGGIGTVSEIFDAEPPFAPRGCIAQAWGVAEVLRVIKKYKIEGIHTVKNNLNAMMQ
jgi:predicted glycogen debranching enzyme